MDTKKLKANIEKLQKIIPKKPTSHRNEFPKSIQECLNIYLRRRTIDVARNACWAYDKGNWPLPLYINPNKIRIGYMNELMFIKLGMNDFRYYDLFASLQITENEPHELKPSILAKLAYLLQYHKKRKLQYYDWLIVPSICNLFKVTNIDEFNVQIFESNFKYLKNKILSNDILHDKKNIMTEAFSTYKQKNYASCICTLYPIIDFVTRKYFDSTKFDKDITSVNGVFKAAGFDSDEIDNLKHGAPTRKHIDSLFSKGLPIEFTLRNTDKKEYDLGLPGIALSSFLHFSYKYYEFVRKDTSEDNVLNRHAIIHGSSNLYGTKVNAIKLFTYLYLMLELEPVLKIIFNET